MQVFPAPCVRRTPMAGYRKRSSWAGRIRTLRVQGLPRCIPMGRGRRTCRQRQPANACMSGTLNLDTKTLTKTTWAGSWKHTPMRTHDERLVFYLLYANAHVHRQARKSHTMILADAETQTHTNMHTFLRACLTLFSASAFLYYQRMPSVLTQITPINIPCPHIQRCPRWTRS